MIVLLIVSVAIAAAAPIMSKKARSSSNADLINPKVDVPIGAIMFFHPGVTGYEKSSFANPCPPGWKQLPTNFNDRFIRITDGRGGSRNYGTYQEDAFKEHSHINPFGEVPRMWNVQDTRSYPFGYYMPDTGNADGRVGSNGGFDYDNVWTYVSPPVIRKRKDQSNAYYAEFLTGDEYKETRPKNIALLACVKGNMPDNYKPESNYIPNEISGDVPK